MHRQGPILVVVALVLCAAGVAAAQSMLVGGSPGLTGGSAGLTGGSAGLTGSGSVVSQATPPATGTDASATTPGPSTNGVPATPTPTTTVPGASATGATIDQIVSITRSVDSGTPSVSAFAVPAGHLLIVTDVVITNPGAAPACGASIAPGGTVAVTPASPAPTVESGTGVLCVPAQTSLSLGLTTGLEFAAGQGVVLTTTAGATLHYHLRGFLVVTGA